MITLNLKFILDLIFNSYIRYMKACIDLKFILDRFLVHLYMIYRYMHKPKNYFDLIYDSYMRCIITYLGLKISFNMIHHLYIRYIISCYDLNFV